MQLTRHTDYALRILMYLAANHKDVSSVAEIADYYSISRNHLVKVVQGLTEHGYVSTLRGKNGGMYLAYEPENILVGDVIRQMENHFELVECFCAETNTCPVSGACELKHVLGKALNTFLEELDKVSLADIIKPKLHRKLVGISK